MTVRRTEKMSVPENKISVIRDYDALLRLCAAQDKPVYIMPTYTAMLGLRDRISKLYGFREFWE